MTEDLIRLIYVSRNRLPTAEGGTGAALAAILERARARNRAAGVTGALMADEHCFAQVLEGSAEAVEDIFESIQRDPRHGEVTVLDAAPVTERSFGDWDMAECGPPATGALSFERLSVPGDGAPAAAVLTLLRDVLHRTPAAA